MRLFVAVEIAAEIRKAIEEYAETLKTKFGKARWVPPEGMHITLKFLGNVADEKRASIENALSQIRQPSFTIAVQDVGAFPNVKSPRVLWVGISSGPELTLLAQQVDAAMQPLGFASEKRAFSPHVTLARFGEGRKANISSISSGAKPTFGKMTAADFHLYQSKLSAQGSRYSKLASFALR